jgi:SNF2 family DNA or RNA helicase
MAFADKGIVVMKAFTQNGIKYMSFDQSDMKKRRDAVETFVKDPSYTVFLLHAEKER